MKVTVLDMRKRMPEVIGALERNEAVTLTYRGKDKAVIHPIRTCKSQLKNLNDHQAFGIWKDRDDMNDVSAFVRNIRKGRFNGL
jgi:antitoxin (DNA-binding transcriptional repressor) of toxin-antitoxin stability system